MIWTSGDSPRAQELGHHTFGRHAIEAEKLRGLANRNAEIGRVLEFLSNALNELSKEQRWHIGSPGGSETRLYERSKRLP
jgi:hypothetical protein